MTDMTLIDKDTNSILTDNANRALQGNVAMKVVINFGINASPRQCGNGNLVDNFGTNARDVTN